MDGRSNKQKFTRCAATRWWFGGMVNYVNYHNSAFYKIRRHTQRSFYCIVYKSIPLFSVYGHSLVRSLWIWTNGLNQTEIQMLVQSHAEQSSGGLSNAKCYHYFINDLFVPPPDPMPPWLAAITMRSTDDCTQLMGYICEKFWMWILDPREFIWSRRTFWKMSSESY